MAGSHRFYDAMVNFNSIMSYWTTAFVAIVLVEHLLIRRMSYDLAVWNEPRRLPWGIAALLSLVASLGAVVPCMEQAWYVGPLARLTGDLGFEVAFVVSVLVYVPLRAMEIRLSGRI